MKYRVVCEPNMYSGQRVTYGPYSGPFALCRAKLVAHVYVAFHDWGSAVVQEAP